MEYTHASGFSSTGLNMQWSQLHSFVSSAGAEAATPSTRAGCAAEDGSTSDAGDEQHVCMVCKEGYHLQPSELLGTFVFCEQIAVEDVGGAAPLEALAAPRSAGFVLSSVSHFSLIHIKCHMAGRRADAVPRDPQGCAMSHYMKRSIQSSIF